MPTCPCCGAHQLPPLELMPIPSEGEVARYDCECRKAVIHVGCEKCARHCRHADGKIGKARKGMTSKRALKLADFCREAKAETLPGDQIHASLRDHLNTAIYGLTQAAGMLALLESQGPTASRLRDALTRQENGRQLEAEAEREEARAAAENDAAAMAGYDDKGIFRDDNE